MGDRSQRARLCAGASIFVLASLFGAAGIANAQSVSPDELRTLKAQIDALQAKVKKLYFKQQQSDANATAAKRQASEAQAQAAAAKASASQASATAAKTQTQVANLPVKGTEKDEWFFRHKKGDPLTFERLAAKSPPMAISTCRSTAHPRRSPAILPARRIVWGLIPAKLSVPVAGPSKRQLWLDARHLHEPFLSGRARLPKVARYGLAVCLSARSRIYVSAFPSNRQSNSN